MTGYLIKGGLIVTPLENRMTDLLVEGNKIIALGENLHFESDIEEIDATACYVSPGLFDIQVNGGPECDFWEELSEQKLAVFSQRLLNSGVTSILPTLITADLERLKTNRDFLKAFMDFSGSKILSPRSLFRMPGIHFEGPCLSPEKPGVHPKNHLKPLELSVLRELIDESCLLMTLAPELDPKGESLKYLSTTSCKASLGHSNASFDEASQAFARGVKMMTHTFNALPALHHRQPGAVTAAFLDPQVSCCVIPDGLHLDPAIVKLIYKIKGPEKTVLVSDIAAVGTSQGGLVGSSLVLDQGVRNLVSWQLADFASAIRMASYNPAAFLGLENSIGQIKAGAFADLILWDRKDLSIKKVIFDGKAITSKQSARKLAV